MNFSYRSATPNDAQAISALILSLAGYFVEDADREEARGFFETLDLDATRARLETDEYRYIVCEDGRRICGVIGLKGVSHLYHLFVDAKYHGHGIARRLWELALDQVDAPVITVNSSLFAVSVYEKLGFVQAGDVKFQDGLRFMPMEYISE